MQSSRTIISIPEETKAWLESYSKIKGISIAEAIRKGITKLRQEEESDVYQTLLERTKGIWNKGDGLKYQQKMRSEWI